MANIHVGRNGLDSSGTVLILPGEADAKRGKLHTGLVHEDDNYLNRQITSVQGPCKRVVDRDHCGGDMPPRHCMGCSIWIPRCPLTMYSLSI